MITPRKIVPTSLRKSGQLWTRLGLGASTCRAMGACCQGQAPESTASADGRMPCGTGSPAFRLWSGLFRLLSMRGWDDRLLLSFADLACDHPGARGGARGWIGNQFRASKTVAP